jgi:hypothetical protein
MIDDYNSRCSSYKYPQGLLQRVESETEALRSTLEAEGRSRFL